jgi:hypothetical protein
LDSYKYHRRARFPRLSHRSVDWQPNDHLGRSCFRTHLFKHRRQILRGRAESDTNSNGNGNRYFNSNSNSDSAASVTDRDCNGDNYARANGHSAARTHAEASSDFAAAADSGTATVEAK